VRVGQIEVQVGGEGGERKLQRMKGEAVLSPVLKVADMRVTEVGRKQVVVFDVDEDGKVKRLLEEDADCEQPVENNDFVEGGNLVASMLEYKSVKEDNDWASFGIVATVSTKETLWSVQERVEDVGFRNVEVIPMGGEKVFLRSRIEDDIMTVFNDVINFFGMLFSNVQPWQP